MFQIFDLDGPSEGDIIFPSAFVAKAVRVYPVSWKEYPLIQFTPIFCKN